MKAEKTETNEKNAGGRPTAFKQEYIDLAYKFCLLGATDEQLAEFFNVAKSTINLWKQKQPKFLDALKRGKVVADANVAQALYRRATGYSHPETHVSNYQGQITLTEITKHYPPDTGAACFWLKNRQPDKWRNKVDVSASVKLDKETLEMIENQFITKMAEAHERQKEVLKERGIATEE
ncbi:helix-turn-helix domain-containing protein [Methylobacter sp.]|uniref:helix-turn-helix domain-containing protein n=1 Tax=Methylobacter sp. TaxID=2051955 RepID=UPI002FDEF3CD